MKKFFKSIRATFVVNFVLRSFFKLLIKIGFKFSAGFLHHIVVSGKVKIPVEPGKSFFLYSKGDDFIPTAVFWGGFDAYEIAAVPYFQFAKKSKVIFDVGANIGFYSLLAATANPSANIYSFEPVPKLVKRFNKQIEINNFKNVIIEEIALSDKNGKISFYVPTDNSMALASSVHEGWLSKSTKITVDAETISSYKERNNLPKIDLIKMDCEFHEVEVLKGSLDVLAKDEPDILMEVLFPESEGVKGYFENEQHLEISRIMKEHGYSFYQITNSGLQLVSELIYHPYDRNYLFTKNKFRKNFVPYNSLSEFIENKK